MDEEATYCSQTDDFDNAVSSCQHEDSIRVFVRIRPLNKRELVESQTMGWNYNETSMIEDTQNGISWKLYNH